jgi:glycosyltransferase involved in cell wall biosynthesis
MTNILVLGHTTVGSTMASGGIRSYHIARVLQEQMPEARVTLAIPRTTPADLDPDSVPFAFDRFDGHNLGQLAREHDIAISTRFPLKFIPAARNTRLVLDLFTPFFTEWVEMTKGAVGSSHRRSWIDMKRRDLLLQLAASETVLVSNERQRDLVAGMMGTSGLISRQMLERDPTLSELIREAPIGVRPEPPVSPGRRLRGVFPGIGPDDFVMIWNGIIVDWYDIDLLLHAVHRLKDKHPHMRLFFMGTEHPDSYGTARLQGLGGGVTSRAIALCEELGILDKHVFFNFTWANDADSRAYLLESDIAVCTYFASLETRYSFRVRYLDVLWASLPLVSTEGDLFAEMVRERGMGISVPEGDLDALTAALDRMVSDTEFRSRCRERMALTREEYAWERTLAPLVDFCRTPAFEGRRNQTAVGIRAFDWLASRAYYEARFGVRRSIATWQQSLGKSSGDPVSSEA